MPSRVFISCLLLFSLTAYAPSLRNGFVWDDEFTVELNSSVESLSNLRHLFTPEYFGRFGELTWRPVATASYVFDHSLWGKNPAGHHATSLALHLAVVLTLFLWLSKLLGSEKTAFAVAALQAVHPAFSEAVFCISYREDLLAALFSFLALEAARRRRETAGGARVALAGTCGAFALLGCLSKESASAVFPALFFQEWVLLRRYDLRKTLGDRLFWTVVAGSAALYFYGRFVWMTNPATPVYSHAGAGPWVAMATQADVFLREVGLLVWPLNLSGLYLVRMAAAPSTWQTAAAVALVLAGFGLAARMRHREPGLLFGSLFFLFGMAPVSGIIPIAHPMAERYLYLPASGLFLFAALCAKALFQKRAVFKSAKAFRISVWTLCFLFLAALTLRTAVRAGDWRDHLTFWEKTVSSVPDSPDAHYNLAVTCMKSNLPDRAEREYLKAIDLNPSHAPAHNNLAMLHSSRDGDLNAALDHVFQALKISPKPNYFHTLGVVALKMNRPAPAREALSRIPEAPENREMIDELKKMLDAAEIRNAR